MTLAARETTIEELAAALPSAAAVVIDVREPHELGGGRIAGALTIPKGELDARIAAAAPDRARPIVLYCASGARSSAAARTLDALGYSDVRSLRGGFKAWQKAGLPIDGIAGGLTAAQRDRYSRHILLPEEIGRAHV